MTYECNVCGMEFEYKTKKDNHQEINHNSSIRDHVDNSEVRKLNGMLNALRKNDYDKKNIKSTTQLNLKKQVVDKNTT